MFPTLQVSASQVGARKWLIPCAYRPLVVGGADDCALPQDDESQLIGHHLVLASTAARMCAVDALPDPLFPRAGGPTVTEPESVIPFKRYGLCRTSDPL
jgi:hypothetical protein